jgi:hypothetical protein
MPPVIPTSFVPRPSTSAGRPKSSGSLGGLLSAAAYFILGLAVLSAIGVYAYGSILASEQATKDAAVAKTESTLDQSTIEQFIRLHDRLTSSQTLLDSHVALSPLFDLLETVTPQDASFSSVSVNIDDQGNALLVADGTAKSFNALAAASDDFGTDARLKNAIFSNLSIATNGTVSFVLSATLNPTLIAYTGTEAAPEAPVNTGALATSTPALGSTTTTTSTSTATTTP